MRRALLIAICLLCALCASAAAADYCAELTAEQRGLVDQILTTQHLYDCCDMTIAQCLEQSPRCELAVRIEQFVCRLAAEDDDQRQIEAALNKRALSMSPTLKPAQFDLSSAALAGDPQSPVKLTIYLCLRCPYCSRTLPWLYREVSVGGLHGKVELRLKNFPLKGHAGSVEGGLAAMAALEQGKMYEYYLYAYEHYSEFSVEKLPQWAAAVGLDIERFARDFADPALRERLAQSKREGYANSVNATPTLFINGRRYQGFLDRESLIDVLLEEYNRVTGKIYQ
ncbi:MAG: thioredoxin domain-containing protein [Candidatus Alcyoniella australis]|nr:thioredoxin domain-containing protein [Candidatus Alcyoniella australis]